MSTDTIPIVGVSLGHRHQKTAISVIERVYVPAWPGETFTAVSCDYRGRTRVEAREPVSLEYRVRHLECHGPPTRYAEMAQRIPEVLKEVTAKNREPRSPHTGHHRGRASGLRADSPGG